MKILHVIPSVSERSGGPGHAIISMCRSLQEQGTEVVIATTDHGIVSSSEFRVSSSEHPVSSFEFRVSGSEHPVSSFEFRVPSSTSIEEHNSESSRPDNQGETR